VRASVNKQVATYVAFVALFSLPFYWAIIRSQKMGLSVLGLMGCPALASIVTALIYRRSFRIFGWRWPRWSNIWLGCFVPLAYALIAYLLIWSFGFGHFPNPQYIARAAAQLHLQGHSNGLIIATTAVMIGTVDVVLSCISALGEEIGWRGFMVPVLSEKYGWAATSLISGVVWACWHMPAIFAGPYHGDAPAWYSAICFFVMVVAIAFLFSWLRLRSGSVWPCALLHASHNAWIQAFFTPITVTTPQTKWWIDEFGAMLAIVTVVWVLVLAARKPRLSPQS
jgi:membrane protease YdiL (CAAX protease family)